MRGQLAERGVRCHGVVISEPSRELVQYDRSGRDVGAGQVVPAHGVHECFRHAVRLWARGRRGDGHKVQPLRRDDRIERRVDAAVVAEPLDRLIGALPGSEPGRDRLLHELLNIPAQEVTGHRDVSEHLTVVAIESEAHLDDLTFQQAISSTSLHPRSFDTARWISPR